MARRFRQVDVFSERLGYGNPLAVVADADGLDDETMARFARWTNLSETTFLMSPTDPRADYRVRIFTPGGELPFAGHPTLGSCRVWLELGGEPAGDEVVQECGVGLVRIRTGEVLAFAAPPLRRSEVPADALATTVEALGIDADQVLGAQVLDNGPVWLTLHLDSAATVLGVDSARLASVPYFVGIVGVHEPGTDAYIEVRGFTHPDGIPEDPVTGSLNASIAQWLVGEGVLPTSYVAAQGTALGRAGRVHVTVDDQATWVGGRVTQGVEGTLAL